MGASKTHQFSDLEIGSALIARALAHPARIKILLLLKDHTNLRNVDLVEHLSLSRSTVNNHLTKLKDAELIELEFHNNSYLIRKNKVESTYPSGILDQFFI